jgi:hypothetical protein
MEINAEQLSNSYYAYVAWEKAVNEGYVYKSIEKYVGQELYNLMIGGLAGIVLAVGSVVVGSAVGAGVGAALGGYFSAGNPAVATATAELGATIGKTVAEVALAALGVLTIVDYIGSHLWEIGRYTMAAYDLATNQAPYLSGQLYNTVIDLSARWFAEAVGMFCGFLVFAIATCVLVRMAQSKSKSAVEIKDLFESKLNQMCKGIVQYIMPRAAELQYKLKPAGRGRFVVVSGGVGPGEMSIIARTSQFARRIMPRIVDQITCRVLFRSFQDLNSYLTSEGFRLTSVGEWGPKGGRQLFYERGNVCCRVKTMGDAFGDRAGVPHISFGMNDGLGTAWYNDMAKFSFDGRLSFKNNTPLSRFSAFEKDGTTPQRYIGIQGGKDLRDGKLMQDQWAARSHFNLEGNFSWAGVEKAMQGVTR